MADAGELLRIALVAPVAQPVPPPRSGSIEILTALLADGLVARGHEVTLFATGGSSTRARLHAVYPHGYLEDPSLWPWELCEVFNISAAIERARSFDLIHCQAEYAPLALGFAELCPAPLVHTVHHLPNTSEAALWSRYPNAPFIAVSATQAEAIYRHEWQAGDLIAWRNRPLMHRSLGFDVPGRRLIHEVLVRDLDDPGVV